MKKFASLVMAGMMGFGFSMSVDSVAFADSQYALSVEKVAPAGGYFCDFSKGEMPQGFEASDGWTNGFMFNCNWHKENITFENKVMNLTIDDEYGPGWSIPGIPYTAGEFRSKSKYHYGRYEVCMKPIKNDGVVTSYFTYTGPYDGTIWDEIDIEVLGKDTTHVQFNYFTDSKGNHEYYYDMGFDGSKDFHVYAFEWYKNMIVWYIDGVEAHRVVSDDVPVTPSKIMANVWPGKGVDEWLKPFDDNGIPATAEYKWAKFTPFDDATAAAGAPAK